MSSFKKTMVAAGPIKTISDACDPETDSFTDAMNNDSGHPNLGPGELLYKRVMMVGIGALVNNLVHLSFLLALCFPPATSNTGAKFYMVINLESAMRWRGIPDVSTTVFWLSDRTCGIEKETIRQNLPPYF
ncbi:hypothetical protein CJP72_21185 [Citrobacter sp. NCU1]|uniref:3'-5' exoribonuclease n=1 Tax=Citrobacter sp. NCU1 TaxID=2026683 RepID=UPI001391E831|nr:3'-5' exoribonuclease [Citrobacter sp. NCU1]NDO83190.1 hypothetical protein [Citrobacter sp. NCU1]